jgi:hypothetical protein
LHIITLLFITISLFKSRAKHAACMGTPYHRILSPQYIHEAAPSGAWPARLSDTRPALARIHTVHRCSPARSMTAHSQTAREEDRLRGRHAPPRTARTPHPASSVRRVELLPPEFVVAATLGVPQLIFFSVCCVWMRRQVHREAARGSDAENYANGWG